jgi:type I restriction enzyme S subunit
MQYVSVLTQAIINKEKAIRDRHENILVKIETELLENQKENKFNFNYPTFKEIEEIGRLDTNLYREKFKQIDFTIKNYINGYLSIFDLGFELSRGQNLQVSNIGKSIYSSVYHKGFYTLMLPKHLSKYGTVDKKEYLGNAKKLKTLKIGDLIFGAEGFEKGRSIVIIEKKEKTITNIHGITIQQEGENITKAIFVKCFLDYLRHNEIIDLYAVGGNGGSLAQKYWDYISFPNFKEIKQKEIVKLYHNSDTDFAKLNSATLDNFLKIDNEFNSEAGIYELDKSAKRYKERIDEVIDKIANDENVEIIFDLFEKD